MSSRSGGPYLPDPAGLRSGLWGSLGGGGDVTAAVPFAEVGLLGRVGLHPSLGVCWANAGSPQRGPSSLEPGEVRSHGRSCPGRVPSWGPAVLLVCRVRPFSGGGSGSVRSGPSTWRPVPRGCERLSSEGESDGRQWPPGPGAPQAGGCQRGGRGGSGLLRGLTLDWAAWPGCPPCGEPPQSRLPPVLFPGGCGPRSRASLERLCGGDVPASGHVRRQPAPSPAWPEPHLTHFCFLSDFLDPVSKPFCSGDCAQVMTTNPKPNKALKVSGVGVGRLRFCLGLRLGKGPFRPSSPSFPGLP